MPEILKEILIIIHPTFTHEEIYIKFLLSNLHSYTTF